MGKGGRGADVAEEVAGDDRHQDGDPAHRRRARLQGVVRRPVDADLLADPPADQPAEQDRRPEPGNEDRDRPGGEKRDHCEAALVAGDAG